MAKEDWKQVSVRIELLELAEKEAERLHYPNVTQFVNEVLRERLVEKTEVSVQK